jgi:uncharacterized FlaG/YvyC family protein
MQVDPINLSVDSTAVLRKPPVDYREAKTLKPATEDPSKPQKRVERNENVAKLQSTLSKYNISLRFHKDDRTNRIVVDLVDETTGESVMQIPSEVSLKIAADFVDMQRNFVDVKK